MNYPEDLRPSYRLPQRLTSRRSTAFFYSSICCGDLKEVFGVNNYDDPCESDSEQQKKKGCWHWLSSKFR